MNTRVRPSPAVLAVQTPPVAAGGGSMAVAAEPPLRTLGFFLERDHAADYLWNQCEGPYGRDGDLQILHSEREADHVLVLGTPASPFGDSRLPRWRKRVGRLRGRSAAETKAEHCWAWLDVPRERVSVLFYEPPPIVPDAVYDAARRHAARVFGPDPRATHPITLPATWLIDADLRSLRAEAPPRSEDKPVPLAAVSSGKSLIPGHDRRAAFFARLRERGVPMELFGRGLARSLGPRGPITHKAFALRPARFVLAIENYAEGDRYVTEKLWDALLCWCVPLYYGSRAADGLIPAEAFIRLPDLGEAGVEAVREALARPRLWEERLDAIAEARRRALGDLRLVSWAGRTLF